MMTHDRSPLSSPLPSWPRSAAPPLSCDCHCHVFGPYDRFALASDRSYSPAEAPAATYLAMLQRLGFDRGVLVQPSAHGLDNAALLDALAQAPKRLRGVAVVPPDISKRGMMTLRDQGVRGLRLSQLRSSDGSPLYRNTVDISALPALLPSMRELGLHAQLWINLAQLRPLAATIRSAGIPFVIDHMGRSRPDLGTADPDFRVMCELVEEGHLWVKLTPYRASRQSPNFEDVRSLHDRLVHLNPERLLWGSDWPHINLGAHVPDAGHLLDLFFSWTPRAEVRQQILVLNPQTLYGFDATTSSI